MMSRELEEKLTPAAREALDELVTDYRANILIGAEASASRLTGEPREISVHDIVEALSRIGRQRRPTSTTLERILTLYMRLGLVIGLAGFMFFALRDVFMSQNLEPQLPLFVSVTGFGLALGSLLYLTVVRRRRVLRELQTDPFRETLDETTAYLVKWRDIELALRGRAASQLGESAARAPISVLMEKMSKEGIVRPDDENLITSLLRFRNKIVHERPQASSEEIQLALRDARKLLARISAPES